MRKRIGASVWPTAIDPLFELRRPSARTLGSRPGVPDTDLLLPPPASAPSADRAAPAVFDFLVSISCSVLPLAAPTANFFHFKDTSLGLPQK